MIKNEPLVMELEAGTYYWCACGRSAEDVFCDGSHKGTGIAPVEFSVAAKRKVALCACRKTAKVPFCDGAHSR